MRDIKKEMKLYKAKHTDESWYIKDEIYTSSYVFSDGTIAGFDVTQKKYWKKLKNGAGTFTRPEFPGKEFFQFSTYSFKCIGNANITLAEYQKEGMV